MLHEFLSSNRQELIVLWRTKVVKRYSPRATEGELAHGIPVFLDQLIQVLGEETGLRAPSVSEPDAAEFSLSTAIEKTATIHGNELLRKGFGVDQVIHDYADLGEAITDLAIERNEPIAIAELRTLNGCLADAIAHAVAEFGRARDRVISDASDQTMNERLGFLAHEFRNLINTSMLAVDALKGGNIGINGSTVAILDRSLNGLLNLCVRALVDVRLRAGIPEHREHVIVAQLIEESQVSAGIEAKSRGLDLVVSEVEPDLAIRVDRQILSGALANLLQNAFKFTKPRTCISLKAFSAGERVLIEIEDECGGLPAGDEEDLFRLFEQRSEDRSGLGLGLGISRRGIEANGGKLQVRNLPGKGCIFSIDLPKASVSKSVRQH